MKFIIGSKSKESRAEQGNEILKTQERSSPECCVGFWYSAFQYSVFTIFSLAFFSRLIKGEDRMRRKNETGAFKEAPPTTSRRTCA